MQNLIENFSKNYKYQSILILLIWLSGIFVLVIDGLGLLGSDIGPVATLQTSSLARGMFTDIGMISTVMSGWILIFTKVKWRILPAILTLFLGSFVLLPYMSYWLWQKHTENA